MLNLNLIEMAKIKTYRRHQEHQDRGGGECGISYDVEIFVKNNALHRLCEERY
jgi:hypothetical protein